MGNKAMLSQGLGMINLVVGLVNTILIMILTKWVIANIEGADPACQIGELGLYQAKYTPECTQNGARDPELPGSSFTGSTLSFFPLFPAQEEFGGAEDGTFFERFNVSIPEFTNCDDYLGDTGELVVVAGEDVANAFFSTVAPNGLADSFGDLQQALAVLNNPALASLPFPAPPTSWINTDYVGCAGGDFRNNTLLADTLTGYDDLSGATCSYLEFLVVSAESNSALADLAGVAQLCYAAYALRANTALGLSAIISDLGERGTFIVNNVGDMDFAFCFASGTFSGANLFQMDVTGVAAGEAATIQAVEPIVTFYSETVQFDSTSIRGANLLAGANFTNFGTESYVLCPAVYASLGQAAATPGAAASTIAAFAEAASIKEIVAQELGFTAGAVSSSVPFPCTMDMFSIALQVVGDSSQRLLGAIIEECGPKNLAALNNPAVCSSLSLSGTVAGRTAITAVLRAFYEEDTTLASAVQECKDDDEDARRIELAQKLVPAGAGCTGLGLLLALLGLFTQKKAVLCLGGVMGLGACALILSALLLVQGAPVYQAVGEPCDPDEVCYESGLALYLGFVAIFAPAAAGVMLMISTTCKKSDDFDDSKMMMMSKVDV